MTDQIELYDGMELLRSNGEGRHILIGADGWRVYNDDGKQQTAQPVSTMWILAQIDLGVYRIPTPKLTQCGCVLSWPRRHHCDAHGHHWRNSASTGAKGISTGLQALHKRDEVVFEVGGVVTWENTAFTIESIDKDGYLNYANSAGHNHPDSIHEGIADGRATYTPPQRKFKAGDRVEFFSEKEEEEEVGGFRATVLRVRGARMWLGDFVGGISKGWEDDEPGDFGWSVDHSLEGNGGYFELIVPDSAGTATRACDDCGKSEWDPVVGCGPCYDNDPRHAESEAARCRMCNEIMRKPPGGAWLYCAHCYGPDAQAAFVAGQRLLEQVATGGVDCPETRRAAYTWAVEDARPRCTVCDAPIPYRGMCHYCVNRGMVPSRIESGPSAVANLPGPYEGATAWASATYESDV